MPTQPWLNGAGINWITTRRAVPAASGARSITSRSDGAIRTQSACGALATISLGASGEGLVFPATCLAEAWASKGAVCRASSTVSAATGRSLFMGAHSAIPAPNVKPVSAVRFQRIDIRIGQSEMVANLVDHHMGDQMLQRFVTPRDPLVENG